jgi:hypothetical protein
LDVTEALSGYNPAALDIVEATPVIVWLPLAILNVRLAVPLPLTFVAFTTTTVPLAKTLGIPLMSPVVTLILNPEGIVPLATKYLVGEFVAVMFELSAMSTVPLIVADVTKGTPPVTVNVWTTSEAGLKLALPLWLTVSKAVPAPTKVTTPLADTVATPVFELAKLSARLELVVAFNE